jgi:hypothetical protein
MYQIAEEHQEAIFLKVNFEVHKFLCDALTVRVLPFFHLYRGAQGRICSFSCTLGTVISILVLFFLFVFFFYKFTEVRNCDILLFLAIQQK